MFVLYTTIKCMKVFWVQGMYRTGAAKKMVQYVVYLVAQVLLLKQKSSNKYLDTLKMHHWWDPKFSGHCCVLQKILSHLFVCNLLICYSAYHCYINLHWKLFWVWIFFSRYFRQFKLIITSNTHKMPNLICLNGVRLQNSKLPNPLYVCNLIVFDITPILIYFHSGLT